MAAAVTPAIIRDHVETGLSDAALQRIIDSEDAAITSRAGATGTIAELALGTSEYIQLRHPASTITTVTDGDVVLAADDDYTVVTPTLLRSAYGSFYGPVIVVYERQADTAPRTMALIDLVKLQLAYSGYKTQGGADLSESPLDLTTERENILRRLTPKKWGFA